MSNQNKTYKLPKGWIWTTIGEITIVRSGGTPDRKNLSYYQGNTPWVKSGELNFNTINQAEESISIQAVENSNAKILPKETVLIALYGATVGKLAILGIDACTNQAIAGMICTKSLNNRYIYYYLLKNRDNLLKQRQGGAQPNISQRIINEFPIPLPPLVIQNQIVTKIEELFSELDHADDVLIKTQGKLKIYKQALLEKAFNGDISQSWRKNREVKKNIISISINDVCLVVTDGSHFSPSTIKDGYPYITVKDITNDRIDFSASKKISTEDFKKLTLSGCNPKKGDVLFSKDGTVGKVSNVDYDKEFVILSSIAILRPNPDLISSAFLFYALKSPSFLKQALDNKKGVAIRRIVLRDLKQLKIKLLPLDEQYEIVQNLETNFTLVDNFEKTIEAELKKISLLKQSLLEKAYEGNLTKNETIIQDDGFYETIKDERKEYLNKFLTTAKKAIKVKHLPLDLMEEIKRLFNNNEFSINQLKDSIQISDEDLRMKLFKILEEDKHLDSFFDSVKKKRLYKIKS